MPFLDHCHDARSLADRSADGLTPDALFLGRGTQAIAVAHFAAPARPTTNTPRDLHHRRRGKRATLVRVVCTEVPTDCALRSARSSATSGRPMVPSWTRDNASGRSMMRSTLPTGTRSKALLRDKLAKLDRSVPGVRNAGLFAMHELDPGVPLAPDRPVEPDALTCLRKVTFDAATPRAMPDDLRASAYAVWERARRHLRRAGQGHRSEERAARRATTCQTGGGGDGRLREGTRVRAGRGTGPASTGRAGSCRLGRLDGR